MAKSKVLGHLMAGFCIVVWGATFISGKLLLKELTPQELLFWRFLIGYLALWLMKPVRLKLRTMEDELLCFFGGITGVTAYFLFQNVALTETTASNVSVIVCVSPLFTAALAFLINRQERPDKLFIMGFLLSMAGIALVSGNGSSDLRGKPAGDLLALLAALSWAVYSILTEKLKKYPTLIITRKIFFYGLLTMLPFLWASGFQWKIREVLAIPQCLHLLYMGAVASAACYGIWNRSFRLLGSVRTNVYLYALPLVTIVFSAVFLKERITVLTVAGVILTMAGLVVSQMKVCKEC